MPKVEPVTDAPTIPDVQVSGVLGKGGQGIVFRGHQEFLDRDVAVKVLHKSVDRDLARFRQEATLLARLQHPNIVACYQAGVTDDGHCYMVLEYIEGLDLYEHVRQNGALSEDSALALVADVACGLKHGYETNARMIHRDVKPQNVLLKVQEDGPGPRLLGKIVDLGLARCLEESMELTRAGAVMGTPSTMAPEQFDNPDDVDHRTDIYGLGCVLFYALTGDPAFKGKTFTAIYHEKTAKGGVRPHKDLDISPGTRRLLDTMIARDQGDRPATYGDLLDQIREARVEMKRSSGASKRGVGQIKVASVSAGVLALAGLGWWLQRSPESEPGEAPPIVVAKSDVETTKLRPEDDGQEATVAESGAAAKDAADAKAKAEAEAELELELEPATSLVQPLSPALSATLPDGASFALITPEDDSLKGWWATGDEPETEREPRFWKLWSLQTDDVGADDRGELTGAPLGKFEDASSLSVTPDSMKDKQSPMPFVVPGASAISHAVPAGEWGLNGRMALRHQGGEDYLLGGWALRRRDGSYLEVTLVVGFPDGSGMGLSSRHWGKIRAAWFKADGTPLYSDASAETLRSGASADLMGADAAALLSQDFLETNGDPLHASDVIAVDFRLRVSVDTYELFVGDKLDRLNGLAVPGDFATNGFCELTAWTRGGFLALRDWKFTGN